MDKGLKMLIKTHLALASGKLVQKTYAGALSEFTLRIETPISSGSAMSERPFSLKLQRLRNKVPGKYLDGRLPWNSWC